MLTAAQTLFRFDFSLEPDVPSLDLSEPKAGLFPPPAEQWASGFTWLTELGRGSFCSVHCVRDPRTGEQFAVKKALRPFPSERARARFVQEMRLVARVTPHPHIVRHYRAWQENGFSFVQLGTPPAPSSLPSPCAQPGA